jgi:hypothetical protein
MTDTVIDWIDIFTRPAYKHIILQIRQDEGQIDQFMRLPVKYEDPFPLDIPMTGVLNYGFPYSLCKWLMDSLLNKNFAHLIESV